MEKKNKAKNNNNSGFKDKAKYSDTKKVFEQFIHFFQKGDKVKFFVLNKFGKDTRLVEQYEKKYIEKEK